MCPAARSSSSFSPLLSGPLGLLLRPAHGTSALKETAAFAEGTTPPRIQDHCQALPEAAPGPQPPAPLPVQAQAWAVGTHGRGDKRQWGVLCLGQGCSPQGPSKRGAGAVDGLALVGSSCLEVTRFPGSEAGDVALEWADGPPAQATLHPSGPWAACLYAAVTVSWRARQCGPAVRARLWGSLPSLPTSSSMGPCASCPIPVWG